MFAADPAAAGFAVENRAASPLESASLETPAMLGLRRSAAPYAIATAGSFVDNGSSNFAGDLSNPFDDARLYVGGGVTLNGTPTFSALGQPLTLGTYGSLQNVSAQLAQQLNPGHIDNLAIDIPAYLVPSYEGQAQRTIDVRQLPLNSPEDVVRAFDSALPSIVHFTGGSLALPTDTVLRNLTIVVDEGDINFNGDRHLLENVTLVALRGTVNLGDVQATNTSVYAATGIHMNQAARFGGRNYLATERGDVIFNGATRTVNPTDSVKVVAHGDIVLNAAANTRGEFWAAEDFFANRCSTIFGSIRATQSITFNAHVEVISNGVEYQPLIGIIDTGFSGSNPDIDYSRIILGRDRIDGDANPLMASGVGNEHGTHILGIIGATQNNGIGIDGMNDQAPIWLGRVTGSGGWADSLIEFVDRAKISGQPHAVANLSFDLTQLDADGNITTRYELTPYEWQALEYARQNGVLIVAAAGNEGDVMSALGQASQMFDNIITIGAADGINRATHSNYGEGLDLLAPGGTSEYPVLSTVEAGLGTLAGTSVAAAITTGAASQVWAANPNLNYRQVIDILKSAATDLGPVGWDAETGFGLLNVERAVALAKLTTAQAYNPEPMLIPTTWGGEGEVLPLERAANFTGIVGNPTAVQINQGLNIRSGPGTSFPRVGKLAANARLEFDQEVQGGTAIDPNDGRQSSTWYHLADGRGWVSALYVGDIRQIQTQPDPAPSSSVPNPFYPVWQRNLSILRNPQSGVVQHSSTTSYMLFEGGSIISSSLGTFMVFGGIRQEYLRIGGLNSWLGAPKSEEIRQGNSVVVQYFSNGYIIWNGIKATAYRVGNNRSVNASNIPAPPLPSTSNLKPDPECDNILRKIYDLLYGATVYTQVRLDWV